MPLRDGRRRFRILGQRFRLRPRLSESLKCFSVDRATVLAVEYLAGPRRGTQAVWLDVRVETRGDLSIANKNGLDVAEECLGFKTPLVCSRIQRKEEECSDEQTEGATHIVFIGTRTRRAAL